MNQIQPEPTTGAAAEAKPFDRQLAAYLAVIGLVLSAVLEIVHMRAYSAPGATSFCSAGAKLDCSTVALSRWSVIAGVPVPVWGIAGFLALALTAWWRSRAFLYLSAFAAVASAGFLAIEVVSIHSVCLFCEGVHLVSWGLFALAWSGRHSLLRTEPMTLFHLFTVPVGIVLEAFFFVSPYWTLFSFQHGVHLPHGVDPQGHAWIGAPTPKITVDEYVDYTCPHCAVMTSNLRRILAEHPRDLRIVRHQYAHMRCPFTTGATHCEFVRAAACAADQGKFWEMDSWLFQHAPGKTNLPYVDAIRALELDGPKLEACIASEATFSRVDAEYVEASRANIPGTPAYVIDGKQYNGGTVLDELKKRL